MYFMYLHLSRNVKSFQAVNVAIICHRTEGKKISQLVFKNFYVDIIYIAHKTRVFPSMYLQAEGGSFFFLDNRHQINSHHNSQHF